MFAVTSSSANPDDAFEPFDSNWRLNGDSVGGCGGPLTTDGKVWSCVLILYNIIFNMKVFCGDYLLHRNSISCCLSQPVL